MATIDGRPIPVTPPVVSATTDLKDALLELEGAIHMLSERLEPILTPTSSDALTAPGETTPLRLSILKVRELHMQVQALLPRIDL